MKFEPVNNNSNKIVTSNPVSQVIDQCYDQGYGSERSPEDEILPPLPITNSQEQQYNAMVVNSMPQGLLQNTNQMYDMEYQQQKYQQQCMQQNYDFITEGKFT